MPFSDEIERPNLTRGVQWLIAINVAIYFLQVTVVGAAQSSGVPGPAGGERGLPAATLFPRSWVAGPTLARSSYTV